MFRVPAALLGLFLLSVSAHAAHEFALGDWGVTAAFPGTPQSDEQRIPTPHGDQVVQRHFYSAAGETYMILRVIYPLVPQTSEQGALYQDTVMTMGKSRPGTVSDHVVYEFGEYRGERLRVQQPREKTHRELRLVLIGSALYVISAEWPGARTPSPTAAAFLASLAVAPAFANARLVEDRERWREIVLGNFQLRYDASRWFRNPEIQESGGVMLQRADDSAGAEFTVTKGVPGVASMEELVLGKAREGAESVKLRKKSRKFRGSASVEELRFSVRFDGVDYENHGYFYTGPEGTMELRAWALGSLFDSVAGDITELLDGLVVNRK
ncbi:MAG: hypothetical protein Q8J74_13260 [Candidatus Didemnitutus sp.]|nr:hypothetical protein [Candidatus Didemnitutus sp.]